jgi:hypothetical protein
MPPRPVLLPLLVFLALVSGLLARTPAPRQEEKAAPVAVSPTPPHQWLGAGSCASMGCHNANGLKGDWRSEYTTWVVYDRHARAYEVLFNRKSESIIKKLNLAGGKPASQQALCLNCHVHNDYEQVDHHPRFAKEDGVSCESCHGPAGDWVSEHSKPQWRDWTAEKKSTQGFWDTRSLTGRARSCTPCHVGAAGMDVNHDLIAAGHPRLAFDFSAYHALVPHHWQDAKDKVPGTSPRARADWEAAAWFVGEATTTQAALELLAARAATPSWPEFAESDCYACHHQLQSQSWRQEAKRDLGQRPSGNLPWNDWYVTSLPYKFHPPQINTTDLLHQIAKLKEVMEQKISPDSAAVRLNADMAAKMLGALAKQFEEAHYRPTDLEGFLQQLATQGATHKAASWDEAARTYLGVVAVYYALRDAGGSRAPAADVQDALKKIRGLLQFPPDSDSPPPAYTPQLLLEPYGLLRKRLGA